MVRAVTRTLALALITLVVGCAGSSGRTSPTPSPPTATDDPARALVTLEVTDASVVDALRLLGAYSGASVDVAADVSATVTVFAEDQPWDLVVSAIVHATGLRAIETDAGVRVAAAPLDGAAFEPRPLIATPIVPFVAPDPSVKIDIDVTNRDLARVMDDIGEQVGATILVDPTVQESVTVSLRRIPWREAVDVIARMTRTEVEERAGALVLSQPVCRMTIQFTRAPLPTVLQLMAAYSGLNIVISGDLRDQVTLDLREGGVAHWLEVVAHAAGVVIERRGDLLVASRRPGWGDADLDGASEPPAEQDDVTRLRLRARSAPVDELLVALAAFAGRPVVVLTAPRSLIDVDFDGPATAAMRESADRAGWSLESRGGAFVVRAGVAFGGPAPGPPTSATLELVDGRAVVVRVQATCFPCDPDARQASLTMIDDRIYYLGDHLVDENDEEIPVRVVEIDAAGVILRFQETSVETLVRFP